MDSGGFIGGGVDFGEYLRAINNAPPNTWIDFDTFEPEKWMRCTDCGAEMSEALTRFHSHEVQA